MRRPYGNLNCTRTARIRPAETNILQAQDSTRLNNFIESRVKVGITEKVTNQPPGGDLEQGGVGGAAGGWLKRLRDTPNCNSIREIESRRRQLRLLI